MLQRDHEDDIYFQFGIEVKPGDGNGCANIGLFSVYISEKIPDLKSMRLSPFQQSLRRISKLEKHPQRKSI